MADAKNVLKSFESFELGIKKLEALGAELDNLETAGFESAVAGIRSKLKDVSAISAVEKELALLKKEIAERKNSVAQVKPVHVNSVSVDAQHAINVNVAKQNLSFNGLFSKEAESFINSELDKRIVLVKQNAEKQVVKEKQSIEKQGRARLFEAEQALKKKYETRFNEDLTKKEKALTDDLKGRLSHEKELLGKDFERKKLSLEKKYVLLFKQQKDELALIQNKEASLRESLKKEFDANFRIASGRLKGEHDKMLEDLKNEKAGFVALQNEHSAAVQDLKNKEQELNDKKLDLKKSFDTLVERKNNEFADAKRLLESDFREKVNNSLKKMVDEQFASMVKAKVDCIKLKIRRGYEQKFVIQKKLSENQIKDFYDSKYRKDINRQKVLMNAVLGQKETALKDKYSLLVERNNKHLAGQKQLIEKDYENKSSALVKSRYEELEKEFRSKLNSKIAELDRKKSEYLASKNAEIENKKNVLGLEFGARIKTELDKNAQAMNVFSKENEKKYNSLLSENKKQVESQFLKRKASLENEFSQKFEELKHKESALSVFDSELKHKESKIIDDGKKFIVKHEQLLDNEFSQKISKLDAREKELADLKNGLKNEHSQLVEHNKKYLAEQRELIEKDCESKSSALVLSRYDKLEKDFSSKLNARIAELDRKNSSYLASKNAELENKKKALDSEFDARIKAELGRKVSAEFNGLLSVEKKKLRSEILVVLEKDNSRKLKLLEAKLFERVEREKEKLLASESKRLESVAEGKFARLKAELESEYKRKETLFLESKRELLKKELDNSLKKIF